MQKTCKIAPSPVQIAPSPVQKNRGDRGRINKKSERRNGERQEGQSGFDKNRKPAAFYFARRKFYTFSAG